MGDNVISYKILPIRMGIGDPSSDNIRPILTGLSLLRDDGTTLDVYGGTLDATNLTLSVNRRLITLTGSESWAAVSSGSTKYFVCHLSTTRLYLDGGICSHFVSKNTINGNTVVGFKQYYSNNQGRNRVDLRPENVSTMSSVDDFKTYLREQYRLGTPVSILVTLVTPTIYQLTTNELKRALISLGVSASLAESRRRIILNSQNNITSTGYAYYQNNKSLTFIDLPGGVKSISNNTFQGCSNLVKVIMPDGVREIMHASFDGCSKLKSINSEDDVINIPNGVTTLYFAAFRSCQAIKAVHIPDRLTTIDAQVFMNCYNLTSIDLPATLTSIASAAFQYCSNLMSITCRAVTPPTLALNNIFNGVPSTAKIYVPAESVEAYKTATYWSSRANYIQAIPA